MVGGFAGALAAAMPRFVTMSLAQIPVNLIVVTLYALNIALRLGDSPHMQVAITLSVIGVGMLPVASWLGGQKVHAAI
jgi:hypothetical protein